MLAINVATGRLMHDSWVDDSMRVDLEGRLRSLKPAEILLIERGLSKTSETVIAYYCGENTARIQRMPDALFSPPAADKTLKKFFKDQPGLPTALIPKHLLRLRVLQRSVLREFALA